MTSRASDSPYLFDLPVKPDFSNELKLIKAGHRFIAGTDEAGRGPLAGPVVAAAVILDPDNLPTGIDDSKRLTQPKREAAFVEVLAKAKAIAFASCSPTEIDELNILRASLRAMSRAVHALHIAPHHVLADGRDVPSDLPCTGTALIKGDQRSLSIAAASVVAKVMRDRMMALAHDQTPAYGFVTNQGYGGTHHMDAISTQGAVDRLHRMSFSPFKSA
jgi:ribonuclease HII